MYLPAFLTVGFAVLASCAAIAPRDDDEDLQSMIFQVYNDKTYYLNLPEAVDTTAIPLASEPESTKDWDYYWYDVVERAYAWPLLDKTHPTQHGVQYADLAKSRTRSYVWNITMDPAYEDPTSNITLSVEYVGHGHMYVGITNSTQSPAAFENLVITPTWSDPKKGATKSYPWWCFTDENGVAFPMGGVELSWFESVARDGKNDIMDPPTELSPCPKQSDAGE